MLLKFLKSRLVGTRAYAVGEVAEVPNDVAKDLLASNVAVVTNAPSIAATTENTPGDKDKAKGSEPAKPAKPAEPVKPKK